MELLEQTIFQSVSGYIERLDWMYIINLIILVEYINHQWSPKKAIRLFDKSFRINAAFRVAIVGLILAIFYYYSHEDKGVAYFKSLIESMIASMAIYAWALKYILNFLKSKLKIEKKV